jgi:hypothetical protein
MVVENSAEGEPVADALGQALQAAKICSAHRGGGLDLDADDASLPVLDDDVDFSLVFVPIVAEAEAFAAPAGDLQDFREDEGFQDGAERRAVAGDMPRRDTRSAASGPASRK